MTDRTSLDLYRSRRVDHVHQAYSNIKMFEKPETVQQHNAIIIMCLMCFSKDVIIRSYWEHIHVDSRQRWYLKVDTYVSIIPVSVMRVRLPIDWFVFFLVVFVFCVLLIVYFLCSSADMANKRVHNIADVGL